MRNFVLFFICLFFISCTESTRRGISTSYQSFSPEFYGCPDSGTQNKNQSVKNDHQGRSVTAQSIYGRDNRRDWFESSDETKNQWARSTLALIENSKIQRVDNGYKIKAKTYGQKNDLCPGVPFKDQPTPALCSGFLIHENLVVTAGHCVNSASQCQEIYFVFDFAKLWKDQREYIIPDSNVYRCGEIVLREAGWGDDFAVVRLDRPVRDRSPLKFRRRGSVSAGEELTLIGHPGGLPSKITEGLVKEVEPRMFAYIDASSGSSGSPVINSRTGVVEGLLVSGVEDYKSQGSCKVEYLCGPNGYDCVGELITPISKVLARIPQLCSL